MSDLHVVVVNYRTPDDLAGFLSSLEAHRPDELTWRLTIVNVDPTTADEDVAEQCAARFGRRARVVSHIENVGYAVACNHAVEDTDARVYALFNADVVLSQNALVDCWHALLATKEWGILGPRQVDQYGRITAGGIFGTRERPEHRGWLQPDQGQFADVRDDVVTVAGSAFFVRAELWQELTCCPTYQQVAPHASGAFLPTHLFYEETWACYHAAYHGWRNVYYGPVRVTHKWHSSVERNGLKAQVPRMAAEARVLFREACAVHGIVCD